MTEPAEIERRRETTRRSVTRDNPFPIDRGGGYFQILVPSVQPQTGMLPAFLPLDFRQRDRILDSTVRADAMWSAAIGIAITKAAALAWETKSDTEGRSKRAQELLLTADATSISGIGGWVSYMGKQVRNFTCTNAGCFTEIIRATGAYGSRIVGLGHLSALRMRRTGDPEYPFIYIDRWGRQHVMRWWQVFNLVDMPDPDESALGVGLCAAERAYQQIRKLAALEMYLYEKISGSRPLALHIVNGLTKDQLTDMMASASENQASKGLSLYMGAIVATTLKPDSPPALVTIPLAELPDGFEAATERDRADLIYANSLGLDPQDLKPMSNQQMGAGAQSEVLNQKAEGRGQAAYRQQLTHMLNQLVFDNKTQFLFTEHDYRDQQAAANVSAARGTFVTGLVAGGVISAPQGQQVLVEQGELPKAFIEQGAQAGSDLSDTDKPEVSDPLNDQSGPPQPTAQPVMQQQAPVTPASGADTPSTPASTTVPPLVPKKTSTVAQPQAVLQQKSLPAHHVQSRAVQAGARRILRQLNRGGAVHTKDDSAGVWRYIHGHPVLIKGGSGGGGGSGGASGGKGKGKSKKTAGAGGASGDAKGVVTDPNATPKPQKKNVPTHGAGGQSKYPTLDAYKKGQISHENALQMLQADIKSAKLAGDQKAVNTLNTQYYGLKKAGPKSTTNTPKVVLPVGTGGSSAAPKSGTLPTTLEHNTPLSEKVSLLNGSPEHMYAAGLETQIKQGVASHSDIQTFHDKMASSIAGQKAKMDGAIAASESAKALGLAPLPSIVKMHTEAQDTINEIHAISGHISSLSAANKAKIDAASTPAKVTLSTLHNDSDVIEAAKMMATNNWLDYDKKAKEIASKHGFAVNDVKDAINKDNQTHNPFINGQTGPTVASVAKSYGLQEAHLKGAQSLIEKHKAGLIADATYNTQMYKITKEAGVSKAQLEKASTELGSAPKGVTPGSKIGKPANAPAAPAVPEHIKKALQLKDDLALGNISSTTYDNEMHKVAVSAGMGQMGMPASFELNQAVAKHLAVNPPLQKTANPITGLSGTVASKVAAMPVAKQDLIKLGAVYDQHGGTSAEYTAAIAAYNAKHGTTLNFSSAGPAVKNVKSEAGMLPTATKPGLAPVSKPSTGLPPSPTVKGIASSYGLDAHAVQEASIAKHQLSEGLIDYYKYQAKIDDLVHKSGKDASVLHSAIAEAIAKDPALKIQAGSAYKPAVKTALGKEWQDHRSKAEANAWGDQHYAQWRKGLTSGETEAFIGYSKHGDGPINNFLRHGKLGDESDSFSPQKPSTVHKRIKHLDDAIAKTSVPENVIAVRGFSHKGLQDMMAKGQDLNGAVFHDNAFVSTSINSSGGFSGGIKMTIHVPKGSKGAYMDGNMNLTKFPGETELLLGRDSNFRIVGYKKPNSSWGAWEVEVEYLGTGPMPAGSYKAQN